MDAVTYPDAKVIEFISSSLIPLRIAADDKVFGPKFTIKWTPTLVILNSDGVEHYRTLGFYSPGELVPSLLLGMGKTWFNLAKRDKAIGCFSRVMSEFPKSNSAPEAIYLNGVSNYIESHDVNHLRNIYARLTAEYPASPWCMLSSPYRLL